MALRSAPLLSLVWLTVAFPESSFGSFSHSFKLTGFAISEPNQGLPHFVMLGHMDDHVLLHYDSETRKMQPRVSWIEKLQEDDPEVWDKMFKEEHDFGKVFTYGLLIVTMFTSEGLHVVQVIVSCDLQGDGSKRGFTQMAYNGESMAPPSIMNNDIEECIALLKKFLPYGNETLLRTEPPVVTVTRRMEVEHGMETHICRVHGFYPRAVSASWTKDGEVWLQDTLHGSVAPNADGTYHYWLSIQINPEERRRYRCHVEHGGLQEPLDVALNGTTVLARETIRPFSRPFTGSFSHSFKLTGFAISEPSQGLPHFVFLGHMDDHVLLHYDSETRKMQPRVSWIEKLWEDDPEFWAKVSKEVHAIEKMFTYGLGIVRIFSSERLHVVQVITGCDLQGDGSKRGFALMAYNGESMGPPSTMNESDMEECSGLLEKFLSYGNETLLRTEPPVVTVTRKAEAEDGMETHICRVHGFYPRAINASWTRDGEVWLQDTLHGSVAPNTDGTYHYWLSIQIDPEERGRYRCHVEHDSLQEPLGITLKGMTVLARGTIRPFSSPFTA